MDEQEHMKQAQSDHDLLIRVDEKLTLLLNESNSKNKDFELRIRRLELWGAIALGISYALQFYFNYLKP